MSLPVRQIATASITVLYIFGILCPAMILLFKVEDCFPVQMSSDTVYYSIQSPRKFLSSSNNISDKLSIYSSRSGGSMHQRDMELGLGADLDLRRGFETHIAKKKRRKLFRGKYLWSRNQTASNRADENGTNDSTSLLTASSNASIHHSMIPNPVSAGNDRSIGMNFDSVNSLSMTGRGYESSVSSISTSNINNPSHSTNTAVPIDRTNTFIPSNNYLSQQYMQFLLQQQQHLMQQQKIQQQQILQQQQQLNLQQQQQQQHRPQSVRPQRPPILPSPPRQQPSVPYSSSNDPHPLSATLSNYADSHPNGSLVASSLPSISLSAQRVLDSQSTSISTSNRTLLHDVTFDSSVPVHRSQPSDYPTSLTQFHP